MWWQPYDLRMKNRLFQAFFPRTPFGFCLSRNPERSTASSGMSSLDHLAPPAPVVESKNERRHPISDKIPWKIVLDPTLEARTHKHTEELMNEYTHKRNPQGEVILDVFT